MTAKIATVAMALMANGLCLLWPAETAPTLATRSARCVMAIRHGACTASAPCACTILDENQTVFALEAEFPRAASFDRRPFCRKGEKPFDPAGPVDPDQPDETCKPRQAHGAGRR